MFRLALQPIMTHMCYVNILCPVPFDIIISRKRIVKVIGGQKPLKNYYFQSLTHELGINLFECHVNKYTCVTG